ncbi:MAG: FapA family protein [Syntrophomonas sp.]
MSEEFNLIEKADGLYIKLLKANICVNTLLLELKQYNIDLHPQLMAKVLSAKDNSEFMLASIQEMQQKQKSSPSELFDLEVSPDNMRAYLIIESYSAQGLSAEKIIEQLKSRGISYGLDGNAVGYGVRKPGNRVLVAAGTYPVHGRDARVEYLYQPPQYKPVLCEDGSVDHYELGLVVPIKAGEVLATRLPPTRGENGLNIFGEDIAAIPGKDAFFNVGKGVITMEEKAIAEFDGALSWINGKITVIRLLTIKGDVDFSTGNIDFMGKVLINGSIQDGFKVRADDDIEIRGGIEKARVTSHRGSIVVQKGIIGKGRAIIKAAKNVEARFIQESIVEAGQNIVISEYTIRSSLKAGDAVLIQGRKGRIMGNNVISARTRIKASSVANCKSLDLRVEGIERKLSHQQIRDLTAKIEHLETRLAKITESIKGIRNNTSDKESLLKLQHLLPEYMTLTEEFDRHNDERKLLVNMLKNTMGEGMIEIGGALEKGMSFGIKDDLLVLENNANGIRMYYDPEQKRIIPI